MGGCRCAHKYMLAHISTRAYHDKEDELGGNIAENIGPKNPHDRVVRLCVYKMPRDGVHAGMQACRHAHVCAHVHVRERVHGVCIDVLLRACIVPGGSK